MLLAALAVFWERMLVLIWVDSVERLGGLVPPNHVFPCSFAVLKNIKLQMKTTEELMSHQWDILVIRCEDSNTYEVILQQNIVFIQASRNYCTVITKEKRYCLSQPMNEVQYIAFRLQKLCFYNVITKLLQCNNYAFTL